VSHHARARCIVRSRKTRDQSVKLPSTWRTFSPGTSFPSFFLPGIFRYSRSIPLHLRLYFHSLSLRQSMPTETHPSWWRRQSRNNVNQHGPLTSTEWIRFVVAFLVSAVPIIGPLLIAVTLRLLPRIRVRLRAILVLSFVSVPISPSPLDGLGTVDLIYRATLQVALRHVNLGGVVRLYDFWWSNQIRRWFL